MFNGDYNGNIPPNYNNYINGSPSKISNKNDVPVIEDLLELNEQFSNIMNKRIKGLKLISLPYQNGEFEKCFSEVSLCKDMGVINDFLRYNIIKKDMDKVIIKSDMVIQIFPTIMNLVNCKYDAYFKTGISSAWTIMNIMSDPIIDVFNKPSLNCIDINREDKITKYKVIIDYYNKLYNNQRLRDNLKYKQMKGLNLKQFVNELKFFLSQCNYK